MGYHAFSFLQFQQNPRTFCSLERDPKYRLAFLPLTDVQELIPSTVPGWLVFVFSSDGEFVDKCFTTELLRSSLNRLAHPFLYPSSLKQYLQPSLIQSTPSFHLLEGHLSGNQG